MRRAETMEDLRRVQALRFLVFNLEMNEGLEASYATLRDEDPFDAVCDHLVVEEATSGDVVGTYRLQPAGRAQRQLGLYSDTEFDLGPLQPITGSLVELGRACVHRDHRNLQVLGLLWRGVGAYGREHGARFFIGCSSLPDREGRLGPAAFALLRPHLAPESFQMRVRPGWSCPAAEGPTPEVAIPRLLRAYLSLGAWICGEPAWDREFGTVDFLTLLAVDRLEPRARHALGWTTEAVGETH